VTKARHWLAAAGASLAALLLTVPAGAATQGSLGAASRGSIMISVSLRAPARVAGLSDLVLDRAAPAQEFCFGNAARGYTVIASGGGPDGILALSNGEERLAYRVEWLTRTGEGPAAAPSLAAPIDKADCAPGSGRLSVALDPAAAERLRTGAPYTGALILTLVPE
jgi:hypothetical protein